MNPSAACIKPIRICVLAAARRGVGPDEGGLEGVSVVGRRRYTAGRP